MKDYYKIGEISKIYGFSKDSLMYYEDLGILKPDRDTNGYRMYSIQDLYRLNLIKELRTLGFSMKKIKEYLENRNLKTTEEILNEELILTETKIKELNSQKNNIINRLKAIAESKEITDFENIELKYIEKRKAIELNANITRDEEFDFCVQRLQNEYEGRFDILGNNNIGSFFSEEALKKGLNNVFKSVFCLIDDDEETYNITLEEGYYVTFTYKGDYIYNHEHLKKLEKYIKENNLEAIGGPLEIYKIDIHETGKPEEFVTEIQIPVKKIIEKFCKTS